MDGHSCRSLASTEPACYSFAESLEHLMHAHEHDLHVLKKENLQLRCKLAFADERRTSHCSTGPEVSGMYSDRGGNMMKLCTAGDAVTVNFPLPRNGLEAGVIEVLGLKGKYEDGVLEWSNGDRWEKQQMPLAMIQDHASYSQGDDDTPSSRGAGFAEDVIDAEATDDEPRVTQLPTPKVDSPTRAPSRLALPRARSELLAVPRPSITSFRHEETLHGRLRGGTSGEESDIPESSPGTSRGAGGSRTLRRMQSATNFSETLSRLTRQSQKETHLPFSKKQSVVRPGTRCGHLQKLVKSGWFESLVWLVIGMSTLIMALEMQYEGIELGHQLSYPGSTQRASHTWPHAKSAFYVFEWVFGLLFTLELVLKLLAFQGRFVCGRDSGWNLMDLVIVFLWWVWQADQLAQNTLFILSLNPQVLRIFRLGRLLRLLKMLRRFSTFDSLHVMTTALKGSAHVFVWACMLLTLFQTMMALILTSTIQEMYLESSGDLVKRQEVYQYFGTFTRSFLSMFELTLANWPPVSRILTENISEWWTIFAILHKLTIGFALVGIINGVFMQETFKVASMDDKIMLRQKQAAKTVHEKKMRALFAHLDKKNDGKLDQVEFQHIVRDKQVRDWLSAQDLIVHDADFLFELLAKGSGEISVDELVSGVGWLKGNVRMLDFMVFSREMMEMRHLFRTIAGLEEEPGRRRSTLDALRRHPSARVSGEGEVVGLD